MPHDDRLDAFLYSDRAFEIVFKHIYKEQFIQKMKEDVDRLASDPRIIGILADMEQRSKIQLKPFDPIMEVGNPFLFLNLPRYREIPYRVLSREALDKLFGLPDLSDQPKGTTVEMDALRFDKPNKNMCTYDPACFK